MITMSGDNYAEISEPITTAAGTYRVRVEYDNDLPNPREDFDQLGTWVSWRHREYILPLEGDLISRIDEAYERGGARLAVRYLTFAYGAVVLPVYGAERTTAGELDERIDDGARITGVIYVTPDDITHMLEDAPAPSRADIAGWLKSEVDQYATWANGEMTGYVIERACCDHVDCDCECWRDTSESCWGYFSVEEALSMGREAIPTEPDTEPVTELDCNHDPMACQSADVIVCECGALIYEGVASYRAVSS